MKQWPTLDVKLNRIAASARKLLNFSIACSRKETARNFIWNTYTVICSASALGTE